MRKSDCELLARAIEVLGLKVCRPEIGVKGSILFIQLDRPLVIGDGASVLTLQVLDRTQIVPCIRILLFQMHGALKESARDLMIAQFQLSHANLVEYLHLIGAAFQRIGIVVEGIFREAPRPQYIRGHLQPLGSSRCGIGQVRLDRRPLRIFMLGLTSRFVAGKILLGIEPSTGHEENHKK